MSEAPLDILIRADASLKMGTGHIFRDLVIAEWLRSASLSVAFASRPLPGNLIDRVRQSGFDVYELAAAALDESWLGTTVAEERAAIARLYETLGTPPRWAIVDHYGLDATWERSVAALGSNVAAIDDLANRPHDVRMLLDATLGAPARYASLLAPGTTLLSGPEYAPVRDAFAAERRQARTRDGSIERVGVFYGGVDYTGETSKALAALRTIPGDFSIDVIIGLTNPLRGEIEALVATDPRARVCAGDAEMAQLTHAADLVFGSVGSAIWERCFVGTPSIITTTLDFVDFIGTAFAQRGTTISLGLAKTVTPERLAATFGRLYRDPPRMQAMSAAAFAVCDGFEAARARFVTRFAKR